ncbi:MAG: DEAD/DEAH box helicase family protein [Candidatus Eisenbacteria bacterium]
MRNEADTRAELIDPALKAAGWGVVEGTRIAREYQITLGRLQGAGTRAKQEIADYVLVYRNQKLAVIEAKREELPVTEGLGQAKRYADKLHTRFAIATNGHGIYRVDMDTGEEGEIVGYPTPDALWEVIFGEAEAQEQNWRERFSAIPFEDRGGQWQPRYYQHNAITKTLDAIGQGQDRILLTLATGTGKTAIAFQIAWKLFHSRWNLTDWRDGLEEGQEPSRRPRILFLADRNILADQAFNAFSAFPEDALVRIAPDVIRKKGRVPKNGSVFFTIFQTFMTGHDEEGNPKPSFGDYPPDFFDFIVIDECHRGGANDESNWRGIMEYFEPAVQLGLTATPKRTNNVDTYAYFGDPVYVYSLKEGINDGFLTPFKVVQIATTLDDYIYTPDDDVIEGEIEVDRRYTEPDFNKIIEIKERERKRVEIFMNAIDQRQKTLVFCATQDHALAVRDLISQIKKSSDPNYCVRVTANDGALGEQHLRTFRDNEKTIPTILTTSQKLSTGVDARNVRNIVLMRPINSIIEFKQIVGRGTRLFDGKDYFTIYDFVRAYEHFNDPEWDGEPEEPVPVTPRPTGTEVLRDPPGPIVEDPDRRRREKIKVKLADGKERTIQHMMATSYWSPDGKPMSASQFVERLFGELPELFKDEDELRKLWGKPDTRKKLLEGLVERGYGEAQLAELSRMIDAEKSDLYDVLAYIAFARPTITREERVSTHKRQIFEEYGDKQREFLDFVLEQYIKQGVGELDQEKLPHLLELKYHAVTDAVAVLGNVTNVREMFVGFQEHLYARVVE